MSVEKFELAVYSYQAVLHDSLEATFATTWLTVSVSVALSWKHFWHKSILNMTAE